MTDRSDVARTYELTCTDCQFATTVEGDVDEIFDVIEDHRERMEGATAEHYVDFEALGT